MSIYTSLVAECEPTTSGRNPRMGLNIIKVTKKDLHTEQEKDRTLCMRWLTVEINVNGKQPVFSGFLDVGSFLGAL